MTLANMTYTERAIGAPHASVTGDILVLVIFVLITFLAVLAVSR